MKRTNRVNACGLLHIFILQRQDLRKTPSAVLHSAALSQHPRWQFHKEDFVVMKRTLALTTLTLAAFGMAGCAHHPSNSQIGTGVGAVAGGVVGNALFGGPVGTIGGAAAGALIGNEVGKNSDRGGRRHRH